MSESRIYYEDQRDWAAEDFYALWRYFEHLFQFVGPGEGLTRALAERNSYTERKRLRIDRIAQIQAKRTGRRDEELAALDLERMSAETKYLAKHVLIYMKRYELALERFPNLRGLEQLGPLGRPLYLSANPRLDNDYLTSVDIFL